MLMKVKIDRLRGDPRIELVRPDAGSNRPLIPAETEELFLLQGPRLFNWLIDQCGDKAEAESIAKVSHSTMSRWVNGRPGQVFGQRQDMRSYRSIWFGYPSPFPGFDRIVEEIYGEDQSFLKVVVDRYGMLRSQRWLRGFRGFGLEMLDVEPEVLVKACDAVGIPAATRRRWYSGVTYPKQWAALDLLCRHVIGLSWMESVLWVRPGTLPRRVAKEALRCLIEEAWEPG